MAFTFYTKDQTDTLLASYLTSASASATYLTSATASATYLSKNGGTLSGQVYFAQTPDDQYSLVNRKYVDDAIQSAVFGTITNFTIPGDLAVGGIINGVLTSIGNNIHVYEYIGTTAGFGLWIDDIYETGTYLATLRLYNGTTLSLGSIEIGSGSFYLSALGTIFSSPTEAAESGTTYQLAYYTYSGDRFLALYKITINTTTGKFMKTITTDEIGEIYLYRVFDV